MLPQGEAVLRRGAMAGDRLYVSGTIGDAALGLKLLRAPWLEAEWGLSADEGAFLVDRYRCPSARNALALPLRQCARAAIDVSDGLVGDTGEALQGIRRQRHDRGGARAAFARRSEGGRQKA